MRTTTRAGRSTAVCCALAILATACTGSDAPEDATSAGTDAAPAPAPTASEGLGAGDDDRDEAPSDDEVEAIAEAWIADESGLSAELRGEIALERVERSGRAFHLHYVQEHDDVAVRGATFIVTVLADGTVQSASNSLRTVLPADDATLALDEADAVGIATKAVDGTLRAEPHVRQTWVQRADALRLAWDVRFSTEDPLGSWSVVVDASTGAVLALDDLASDQRPLTPADDDADGDGGASPAGSQATRCDLPDGPAVACVFPVDPSNVTGSTDLTDDEANATLLGVELQGLDDPTDGRLVGEFVSVHPQVVDRYVQDDGTWGAEGRGTDDFTAGMAYHWIDAAQRQLQDLGFPAHGDDPVEVSPVESQLRFNAFYDPVIDAILFGVNPQTGRDYGEDGAVVLHEYGHAVVTAVAGPLVQGEGGAFNEGFADVFSVLTSLPVRGDPGCLGSWVDGDCIRRLDGERTYPDDLRFEPHEDGQIYSGAVWAVLAELLARDGLSIEDCADAVADPCAGPRDQVLATMVASLGYLTPDAGLRDAAVAFSLADEAQFDRDAADVITASFAARGLPVDEAATTTGNGGEPPSTTADAEVAVVIDLAHTYRGDLDIDLSVVDPAGTVLCAADVLDPDPRDAGDDVRGIADLSDTPCAAVAPPTPEQLWVLRVVDTAAEDIGELRDFTVITGGVPHVAAGLPIPVPDDDPTGVVAKVSGTGGAAPEAPPDEGDVKEAEQMPGSDGPAPGAEEVTATLAITHPYRGDLQVRVGVAKPDGSVLCAVALLDPDPQDSADDIRGEADVSRCGALWPPAPDRVWFLQVVDTAREDVGTIDAFSVRGGTASASFSGSVAIPDADPDGALVLHDGT